MPDPVPALHTAADTVEPTALARALGGDLAAARLARRLAARLLGLGIARLNDPPAIWTAEQRNFGVAAPPHLAGLLAVHADCDAARMAGARARVRAEIAMPALAEARAAGRIRETAYRLLCVKTTPDTIDAWLAEAPPVTDRVATGEYNKLLAAALEPVEVPAEDGGEATLRGETPADTRARLAAQAASPEAPVAPLRYDATVAFDAWEHDCWWQAKERIRGSTHSTPSPGATLAALLDFFGAPEVIAAAGTPASLADITPGRRLFVCPITKRSALSTNAGRLEVEAPDPAAADHGLRTPRVLARNARGKSLRWTPTQLKRAFPEVFHDPSRETPAQLARRVRVLLGYPADRPATEPCPPVPARLDPSAGEPDPIEENAVSPLVVRRLDPAADALQDIPPAETRAVTVSSARIDGEVHYREVAALVAFAAAEREGRVPDGATARACAGLGMSERSRQEALWLWDRLQRLPALAAAFRDGLAYGKVRAIAGVATPETAEAWARFARPRRGVVVEACAGAASPGDLPPAVPDGLAPTLPIGTRVPEKVRADLSPAQQATLKRLREVLAPLLGENPDDAAVFAAIAGWYVVARSARKHRVDAIVYQRSAEARLPIELRRTGLGDAAVDTWLAGAFEGARHEAAAAPAATHNARRTTHAGIGAAFPWAFAAGSRPAVEWPLPLQEPGQKDVPVPIRQAVEDRDGFRCMATGCWHDLVLQFNHGKGRRNGAIARIRTDQMTSGPCNQGHADGQLYILNRPDGGTWCWDSGFRRLGAVAPIARQLDAPLVAHLMALARRALTTSEAGAAPVRPAVHEARASYGARPAHAGWAGGFEGARHEVPIGSTPTARSSTPRGPPEAEPGAA